MKDAIDFSYARPTPSEVAGQNLDILVYTGPARPDRAYLDAMRAAGVAVTLIQESDPNRSQQGYTAGVADAQYADSRADEVGYPRAASIAYVVSDGNANVPNSGAESIAAYAKGIADTSLRPFFFYGNEYAVTAALRGAPAALGSWVPSTWGTATLLRQEANLPSPVADTDLNTVHQEYGAWGQTAPTPEPPPRKEQDVIYLEENGQFWQMGLGDFVLLPDKVGHGAELNGAAVVPISTGERIAMGVAAEAQAKAFLTRVGLLK